MQHYNYSRFCQNWYRCKWSVSHQSHQSSLLGGDLIGEMVDKFGGNRFSINYWRGCLSIGVEHTLPLLLLVPLLPLLVPLPPLLVPLLLPVCG